MGTIRCVHGYYMAPHDKQGLEIQYLGTDYANYKIGDDGMLTLISPSDNCTLTIPGKLWLNIMDGGNFTHIIDTEEKIKAYIKEHSERFQFVGHTAAMREKFIILPPLAGPIYKDETRWHLVF